MKFLLSNFWLKILSLILSIILWIYVKEEFIFFRTIKKVPIQIVNIPSNLYIVDTIPKYIKLKIQGEKSIFNNIDLTKIKAVINLKEARLGINIYKLSSANFYLLKEKEVELIFNPSKVIIKLNNKENQ
ncbi:MAG: CdaR family protein [bacterium]